MTQEQWQQAWDLVRELEELPPDALEAAIAARSLPDEVAGHIRGVLCGAEDFEPPQAPEAEPAYGPYRPLRLLGEGAMGSVYLARQDRPLERTVALKTIRPGLRGQEVLERFEIERRALALMDHPNIARVLDAGQTAHGTPYFAMEYVAGSSITRYCDQENVPLARRLELLISACEAIQHAHQKGIVHRDIKPSNVLVSNWDGRPVLKIIDFGIARAMEGAGLDTLGTNFGSFVGTLAHMSPEQTAYDSSQVDTRSDVYALGVLAYELLTGSTPLREASVRPDLSNLPALLERIRTEDPDPPSRRASTFARELAGELDWIILKALDKDPARRYQSASGLAEDLQRCLNGEPVNAGPPSTTYRLKKLAVRHRPLLLTAAAFLAVMVIATVISVRQAIRASAAEQLALASRDEARRAEALAIVERDRAIAAERRSEQDRDKAVTESRRADRETGIARAVADFLQNDLLEMANTTDQADRGLTPSRDLKVREALDRAAARIGGRFRHQPELEAEIRNTIGTTYFNLGLLPQAKEHLDAAWRLRKQRFGANHPDTLESLHGIALVLRADGKSAEAAEAYRQVADGRRRAFGPEDRRTLQAMHSVAVSLRSAGKTAESAALHEKVLSVRKRVFGLQDPDTLRSLNDLAVAYVYSTTPERGLPLVEQAYQLRMNVLGPEHPDTVVTMQAYGMALFSTGQPDKSIPILQRSRELNERLRGPDHSVTLSCLTSLGNAYLGMFRSDESVRYSSAAADGYERVFGVKHPAGVTARMNAAVAYMGDGRFAESISLLRAYLPRWVEARGVNDDRVRHARYLLAKSLVWAGQPAEALEIGVPLIEERIAQYNAAHSSVASLAEVVAQAHARLGQWKEAEAVYRRVIDARRAAKAGVTGLAAPLAGVLLNAGRVQEAEALAQSLLADDPSKPGWIASYLRGILGAALAARGDLPAAEAMLVPAHDAMAGMRGRTRAVDWYQMDAVQTWLLALRQKTGKARKAAE